MMTCRTDSAGNPARRAFCTSERLWEVAANMAGWWGRFSAQAEGDTPSARLSGPG
jgi:hypothetical protein